MFCRNCGKDIDDSAVVCPHCGVATKSTPDPAAAPAPATSNGMAIAGFVLSLLGISLVGLILSIIGLKKSKELGGAGRGLAIAGIVIGAVYMAVSFIVGIAECSAILAALGSGAYYS